MYLEIQILIIKPQIIFYTENLHKKRHPFLKDVLKAYLLWANDIKYERI
jgi:hypothetical protein